MKKTQKSYNSTLRPRSDKQKVKDALWRSIVLQRAHQLIEKYGYLICEYSGERITTLSSMGDDMNDGWGHHIDGNRNNNTLGNCYICKYAYHRIITDNNIRVSQEDFNQGREYFL